MTCRMYSKLLLVLYLQLTTVWHGVVNTLHGEKEALHVNPPVPLACHSTVTGFPGGAGCEHCDECPKNNYSYCLQPAVKPDEPFCTCHHWVPLGCSIAANQGTANISLYAYKSNFKRAAPPLIVHQLCPEGSLIVTLPNFLEDPYWKPLNIKWIENLMLVVRYKPTSTAQEYAGPGTCNDSVCEYQQFVPINSDNETLTIYRANEFPRTAELQFSYRTSFVIHRQLRKNGSRLWLVDGNPVLLETKHPTWHSFNQCGLTTAAGGTNTGTWWKALFVVVIIACMFTCIIWLKTGSCPCSWCYTRQTKKHNDYTALYTNSGPASVELPLLSEELPEVQRYRELMQHCPMILPYKITIGGPLNLSGKFGTYSTAAIATGDGESQANVVTCASPFRLSIDELRDFLPSFEQTALAAQHANITGLLGICDQDHRLVVCIEPFCGASLLDFLHNHRHNGEDLTSDERLRIASGVAQGTAHLETNAIVHTSLNSASVVLDQFLIPKVTNFGIADRNFLSSADVPASKMSFIRWEAPELVLAWATPSTQTQVWSLGVLLWEIATLGELPYKECTDDNELRLLIRAGSATLPISELVPDLIKNAIAKCLELNPAHRPQAVSIASILTGQ